MFRKIVLIIVLFIPVIAFSQQPGNDDCGGAITIPSGKSFCSSDAQYTTVNSTSSYQGSGNDVWFTFTPRDAYDIYITVYGAGNGGNLQSPTIKVFTNCPGLGGTFNQLGGSPVTSNNVTTLYEGGLKIGQLYYISVTGSNTGTFKLCIQNPTNAVKPGQEGITAKRLCSTETVRESNVTGAGSNPNEAAGTCMDNHDGQNTETNSAWFKWTAANSGTLVFTITPTVITDDLDWVLFDLGSTDNSANINAAHAIRCADGNGVDNKRNCPSEPVYYKTGLDFNSTDVSEVIGCGQGQDGKVKYIDMQQDHVYALMVNNPYSQGNGFTIDFTDQTGKAGTGTFVGPQAVMDFQENQPCTVNQNYTFTSLSTNASTLKWDFGDGASIPTATTTGPFTISYSTPGTKTVVLEATGVNGCYTLDVKTFEVGQKPAKPVIQSNKPKFCLGDTIILSTTQVANTTYNWTGPNNFTSDQASIRIPVNNTNVGGIYTLVAKQGNCTSDPATITIPAVPNNPVAAFTYVENQPCTPAQNYIFSSQSTGYSRLVWRFGAGANLDSAIVPKPPVITYSSPGMKTVVLEAYNANGCVVIASQSFSIGLRPATPVIQANKPQFCLGDTIILSTSPLPNTTYSWTGPNNFKSDQASISIPVSNTNLAGTYTLIAIQGTCNSDPATITIPVIFNNPVAAFNTVPTLPAKLSSPVTVRFINQSTNADTYLWDFGDGSTSTEINPEHVYTIVGGYDITLTAFKSNVCNNSVTKGTFVIDADNTLFIPNTFTPNGDNINDEFVVNISNLQSYHISIYNRWGNPLFSATSIFDNWKGIYNGMPLPVGTYYYVIDAVSLNENKIEKSGYITLLR